MADPAAYLTRWLAAHAADAAALGKPLLLEEFGAWFKPSEPNANLETRDAFFLQAMWATVDSVKAGGALQVGRGGRRGGREGGGRPTRRPLPLSPQGALFWSWLPLGSDAPRSEGGGRGLYGVRPDDRAFAVAAAGASDLNALSSPLDGCVAPKAGSSTTASPLDGCALFAVRGLPGTGREGPDCATDVDECARGTHDCGTDPGATCEDTVGGFACGCRWGHDSDPAGEGSGCAPSPELAFVESRYESDGPGLRACAGGDPLPWPASAPGGAYPRAGEQPSAALQPSRAVTRSECMQSCEAAPGCAAADFNRARGRCLLRRAGGTRATCVDREAWAVETDQSLRPMRFSDGTYETFFRTEGASAGGA